MTSSVTAGNARREGWLDALRVLAAFGVIVNHTNSKVFQALTPQSVRMVAVGRLVLCEQDGGAAVCDGLRRMPPASPG